MLSSAPAEVREIHEVNLPHPHDQIATTELPAFTHLRAHVHRLIKSERVPAPGSQAAQQSTPESITAPM